MLALVVDDAAPVPAIAALGERPGRETLGPAVVETADDVAVAVAEHGRPIRILLALGEQERPAPDLQRSAPEAELLQGRLHLVLEIADENGCALRVLAFRRHGHPSGEVLPEASGIEIGFGAGDGGFSGHAAAASGLGA